MIKIDKQALLATLLVLVISPLAVLAENGQADYGQELSNAESELGIAWHNLGTAYAESRKPEALATRAPLPERITNAEIMFLLNSYSEASLLLGDLLEDTRRMDPANLPKVLYYLGESNYQIKNYNLSQKYFSELIELKEKKYAADALKRLIQIGDSLGDLEHVDYYATLLTQVTGRVIPLEVAYAYAKSLIRQNQPKKVIELLAPMDLTSLDGVRAEYFLAVALVMEQQYDNSIQRFEAVARKAGEWLKNSQLNSDELEDLQDIIDLCYMAIGRIYYELGDFTSAVDAYGNISHHSKQFEQMLYDITWTYVRKAQQSGISEEEKEANYRLALSMLDLLLGTEDNTVLSAEARLLEGNLLMRLEDEEQAEIQFQSVVDRYNKIVDSINNITKGFDSPQAYFKQVLATRQKGALGWENIMPEEVAVWAGDDKEVTVALDTLHEVDRSRQWIEEGLQLMETMLETMDTNNRMQFMPELAELQKQQAQMKATFINLSQRIATLQSNMLVQESGSEIQYQLAAAQLERQKLETAYKKIPQNADAYQKRKDVITQSVDETEKAAFKLGAEVNSLVQQLDAMEKWFNSHFEQLNLSDAEARSIKEKIVAERQVIQELDEMQKALNNKLNKDRAVIKFLNEEEQRDQLIRRRYLAAVQKESELLKKLNEENIAKNKDNSVYELIEKRLAILDPTSKEWLAAYGRLVGMVAQSQKLVRQSQEDLAQLQQELATEQEWAQRQPMEIAVLQRWKSEYQLQLDKLALLTAEWAQSGQKQQQDYEALQTIVERIGRRKLTADDLQKALQSELPYSEIINEYSALLLPDRILHDRQLIALGLNRLDVYMTRVRILVERQTQDIRQEILAQKAVFQDYKDMLNNLENGGAEVLSEVSSKAFEDVEKRFNSIVLRADVGLLDLAWNKKENRTRKITQKVEERNMQLELLRQEFGDISEEEE